MKRSRLLRLAIPLGVVAAIIFAAIATFGGRRHSSPPLPRAECERLIAEAQPVVDAISRYEKRAGHPPRLLEDLVPQDLPKVPSPRIASGHDYLYGVEPSLWRFAIPLPGGVDELLMYSPKNGYKENAPDFPVERIGSWAHYYGEH